MKILHTPANVGNQPWILSRHERELGVQSDLVINYGTWLNYPADRILGVAGRMSAMDIIRRAFFGFTAPFIYDVFHYNFGRTSLYWDDWAKWNGFPFLDLRMAKKLGKPVFMTLQGCDIRLAGESDRRNEFTPCHQGKCNAYSACVSTYDAKRIWLRDHILPLCDKFFYLNPELGHYVKGGHFLPYANVDVMNITPAIPRAAGIPRIVHAPSDGSMKGTKLILDALEELKQHYEFELILVQGKPHEEAMELYRSADIVIDQVLCGWYGGFGVEVMAMGKPVLCYLREEDMKFVPDEMLAELPIRNIRPGSLVSDIATVLEQRDQWGKWSEESRRFVERWHNPASIAAAMVDAYQNPSGEWNILKYIK